MIRVVKVMLEMIICAFAPTMLSVLFTAHLMRCERSMECIALISGSDMAARVYRWCFILKCRIVLARHKSRRANY